MILTFGLISSLLNSFSIKVFAWLTDKPLTFKFPTTGTDNVPSFKTTLTSFKFSASNISIPITSPGPIM